MRKLLAILVLYIISQKAIAKPTGRATTLRQGPKAVQEWFSHLPKAHQKLTKLHFYFHDTVSGKHPSAVTVARPDSSLKLPNVFGIANVMDDPLTVGPEPSSEPIGRAKGIYASASLGEPGLLMAFNCVFTGRKYNGSTLSVLGHNAVFRKYRELPIVGGSGVFRLASGVAVAETVWFNVTSGDAVVEYSVFVLHYQ